MRRAIRIIISSSALLAACATTPNAPRLPLPPPLVLPRIQAAELACLTPEAATRLAQRDQLLADRVRTLEGIIQSSR